MLGRLLTIRTEGHWTGEKRQLHLAAEVEVVDQVLPPRLRQEHHGPPVGEIHAHLDLAVFEKAQLCPGRDLRGSILLRARRHRQCHKQRLCPDHEFQGLHPFRIPWQGGDGSFFQERGRCQCEELHGPVIGCIPCFRPSPNWSP